MEDPYEANATAVPNAFFSIVPDLTDAEVRVSLALFRSMLTLQMLVHNTRLPLEDALNALETVLERGFVQEVNLRVYSLRYAPEPQRLCVAKPKSSKVSGPRRLEVFRRDNFTYRYCGETELEEASIDHVFSKGRGGNNSLSNLTTCCRDCNNRKGPHTPQEAGMPFLPLEVTA